MAFFSPLRQGPHIVGVIPQMAYLRKSLIGGRIPTLKYELFTKTTVIFPH